MGEPGTGAAPEGVPPPPSPLPAPGRLRALLDRHHRNLWYLHSAWSLAFGIGFMWLGAKNFSYLRIAVFHIAFIWLTSLFVPALTSRMALPEHWAERVRLAVNYVNKNFFQQMLFFVLPVYWRSTTLLSLNVLFLAAVALTAVLSTLDTVYDHRISTRWGLMGIFLAFNMFACFNVMLPILWRIPHTIALAVSALGAMAVFASFCLRMSGLRGRPRVIATAGAALLIGALVLFGRGLIPPAPLELAAVEFGPRIDRGVFRVVEPLAAWPAGRDGTVYVSTAIRAPLGLTEQVRHTWFRGGKEVWRSRPYTVSGGRGEGYRLWTQVPLAAARSGETLRVDVTTAGGQLIGRATLPVR